MTGFSTYFGKMGYTTNVGNSLSRFISKVSNKVLFGQHETEFFDQEFGFKQDVFFPLPFSQF